MRNISDLVVDQTQSSPPPEQSPRSLTGAVIGLFSWLFALGMTLLIYGSNPLFFFIYTWPFFLALMPIAMVIGIAFHFLVNGRLFYSVITTLVSVVAMFGLLFIWLRG